MIGLDQNLVGEVHRRPLGRADHPGFVERFGRRTQVELQRWVDAAARGTIDGPGVWDGYAAVAVCEAGVEAVRSGQKVPVTLGERPASAGAAADLAVAR